MVSPVGMHPLSTMIKAEFHSFDVNHVDLAPESQEPPPISSVWVNDKGQRSVVSANTAGRTIPPARVDPHLLDDARVVMVDGHAMEACQRWADAARLAGISVVLDAGSWKRGTDILSKSIEVAICSEDFLPPGCRTDDEVIAYLHSAGVSKIAITHGADPIQYSGKGGEGMIEVPQVAAVDTTGAGDIFHGAFCYYYASGYDFERALRKASIIASESCRFPGTRQWMRERPNPTS
jgi:sugar/nucleoside kinase (ribokinase family)